jgi:hypothetical protein
LAKDVNLSYRATQLWWNLTAEPLPEIMRQQVENVLNPDQRQLFYRYQESDQWHAYRVFTTLLESGYAQPDLLAAALLHDVGKTKVKLSIWDRILIVVAERLLPDKSISWGEGDMHSWKRPFVVRRHHPHWGADMARAAGCSACTIDLINRHQDPLTPDSQLPADRLLRQLQWADDLN